MNPFDQFDKPTGIDPMQASRDAILKRGAEMGFNPYGTVPEVKVGLIIFANNLVI